MAYGDIILLQAGIPWEVINEMHPTKAKAYIKAFRRFQVQTKVDLYESMALVRSGEDPQPIIERWQEATRTVEHGDKSHTSGKGMSVGQYMQFLMNSGQA